MCSGSIIKYIYTPVIYLKLRYSIRIKDPKYIPQTLVETVLLTPVIQWTDVDVTDRRPVFVINTLAINYSPK